MKNVLVLSAARTPIGAFLGSLSSLSASEIGAQVLRGCLERTEIPGYRVDQVLMGNVLQAGQGQARSNRTDRGCETVGAQRRRQRLHTGAHVPARRG